MKLLFLLAAVALANARVLNRNDCEGIPIDGIDHNKITLKDGVDKPYQLSIDYNTNILYFSYSSHDADVFKMAYLNLKTNDYGTISKINGPFASTVDSKTRTVFFGGSDGIYKLRPNSFNEVIKLQITDENIWQLFSKEYGLYFTTYPEEEAFVYRSSTDTDVEKVFQIGSAKAMLIAVDNQDNIIYANSDGLYLYDDRTEETKTLGDYAVNGFAADIDGHIFFSTPTAIFKIEENTHKVKELARINNVYGLAIESDGTIIYAAQNSIVRLKSNGKVCSDD